MKTPGFIGAALAMLGATDHGAGSGLSVGSYFAYRPGPIDTLPKNPPKDRTGGSFGAYWPVVAGGVAKFVSGDVLMVSGRGWRRAQRPQFKLITALDFLYLINGSKDFRKIWLAMWHQSHRKCARIVDEIKGRFPDPDKPAMEAYAIHRAHELGLIGR